MVNHTFGAYGHCAGTYFGGWRIVHTMGSKITKLRPLGGFCAESAGALTLFGTALWPVSQSARPIRLPGAIIGVGAIHRISAVRWGGTSYRLRLDDYNSCFRSGCRADFLDHPDGLSRCLRSWLLHRFLLDKTDHERRM
jgi:hypothetical protein